MKGFISWIFVAAIGFALMAFSYFNYQYEPGPNPWQYAFMYIGKSQPNPEAKYLEYVKRRVRLLPLAHRAQSFAKLARNFGWHVWKSYHVAFQEKVVLYHDIAADFDDEKLQWGRLPAPGANEVVAGFYASSKDMIIINGQAFKVVGQLRKKARLFVDSYLICDDTAAKELFNPDDAAVQNAYIFRLPKEQLTNLQMVKRLRKAFPKSQFVKYVPLIRTRQGPFYLYVMGLSLLLLGGCVVLFKIYCFLAGRLSNKWLHLPLAEISRFKHLFLSVHLIFFGTVLLFMLVAHHLAELQVLSLTLVKAKLMDPSSSTVAKVYMSKNILWAAILTFAFNFILGSLVDITVPSVIIPGAGVLSVAITAVLWGLTFAPCFVDLSASMLPHSFTMLLEGEAYVMAAFFTLLIPVYLFRKAEGPSPLRRYGKALLMNVRGNLLVAIVLAVAAIYEAIEVILPIM